MERNRVVVGWALLAVVLTGGCATSRSGQAVAGTGAPSSSGVPTSSGRPSTGPGTSSGATCSDITHSDPTIAFESPLYDGARIRVGGTGWISSTGRAADITVSGPAGVVVVSDRSLATTSGCGQAGHTVTWIEVAGKQPGAAVLTLPDGRRLRVTVG